MSFRYFLAPLFALFPVSSFADVAVPKTPAGQALSAFLEAVNSGDRAIEESFLSAWPSKLTVDDIEEWKKVSGGYDLLEVRSSDPTNVFFRIRQKARAVEEAGRLQVSEEAPVSLRMVNAWRMPPGATFDPITLDDAARARVVESAAGILEQFHFLDVLFRQDRRGPSNTAEIETAVLLTSVRDLHAPVAFREHHHRTAFGLKKIHVAIHAAGGGWTE